MLLVCIRSYLKSVLRYKFLVSDTRHPDTRYLHEQVEDPWLFLEAKRGPRAKTFGNHYYIWLRCKKGETILQTDCYVVNYLPPLLR
jgi:hypothetical protein